MAMAGFLNQAVDFMNLAGTILAWCSPLILLGVGVLYVHLQKKYPVDAIIYELRDNNIIKGNDRIGRFYEQGIWKYKFKKTKDTVPIVNHDWIIHTNKVATNPFEAIGNFLSGGTAGTLEFFKYGSKQYKPIKTILPSGVQIDYEEIRDKKTGESYYMQVYTQINPHRRFAEPKFEVIDWDNINFMIQEQRATDERRKAKESWLKTYGVPLIMIGTGALAFIFALYFSTGMIQSSWGISQSNIGGTVPTTPVEHATGTEIPIISNALTPS
jgi:hypothetical protein